MCRVLSKNQMMSLQRRKLACMSLLILMLLQFQSPCYAGNIHDKLNRFKAGSSPGLSPHFKSQHGFKGSNTGSTKHGDNDIFGGEMRKVYTGPNPLHNR